MELSHRDIVYCKGVGAKRADILRKELGVQTALDMLRQYPFKYIDRSKFYKIAEIEDDETYVQIVGEVTEWHTIGVGKAQRLSAQFSDGTHLIELVWFKGVQYVKLQKGVQYLLFGKPTRFNHQYNFVHPELTPMAQVKPEMTQGLEPYYNTTERMKKAGINSRVIRTIIAGLMPDLAMGVPDTIGADVLQHYHLPGLTEALQNIHFPKDTPAMQRAKERLKFEELFYIQLQILRQMKRREQNAGFPMPIVGRNFNAMYQGLPFPLTNAQKRVIREIHTDLKSGKQMNRLLQGDVGSGKTLVALMTMLIALDNGYQACIMAPTEILAEQHLATIREFLGDMDIRVELLTGIVKGKKRKAVLEGLMDGSVNILVGTHAVIEDTVQFLRLGLVVVDEQHRFGVAQRAKLWNKSQNPPHVLVMTATPIPRTLAMTIYGDLDVSVIDQLPPGRKPVVTLHKYNNQTTSLYSGIRQQIKEGRQVYIVFPLIKESEKLDLQNLEEGFETLKEVFPEYRLSKVHGKMKAAEKEEEMQKFVKGETQILVATTVIEVGVNVPNASVMVILNAERFGLSQLHQLRGRVGRGASQSYCILVSKPQLSDETRKRINIMCDTNDGFLIAEADLKLRGPGDLEGTQQSGMAFDLKIADIARDGQIVQLAREEAQKIIDGDPNCDKTENSMLWQRLAALRKTNINWSAIS